MNKDYFSKEEMEYIYADIFDSTQDIYAEIQQSMGIICVFINTVRNEGYHFDIPANDENIKYLNALIHDLRRQRVCKKLKSNYLNNQSENNFEPSL